MKKLLIVGLFIAICGCGVRIGAVNIITGEGNPQADAQQGKTTSTNTDAQADIIPTP